MVLLSDTSILKLIDDGKLVVKPLNRDAVKIAYIELTLGNKFATLLPANKGFIDPLHRRTPRKSRDLLDTEPEIVTRQRYAIINVNDGERYMLEPGEFALGVLKESIAMPSGYIGMLHSTRTLGRLGVQIFCSGGFIDPGFDGVPILEIFNANKVPLVLYPGMRIAKMAIQCLSGKPTKTFVNQNGRFGGSNESLRSWVDGCVPE